MLTLKVSLWPFCRCFTLSEALAVMPDFSLYFFFFLSLFLAVFLTSDNEVLLLFDDSELLLIMLPWLEPKPKFPVLF